MGAFPSRWWFQGAVIAVFTVGTLALTLLAGISVWQDPMPPSWSPIDGGLVYDYGVPVLAFVSSALLRRAYGIVALPLIVWIVGNTVLPDCGPPGEGVCDSGLFGVYVLLLVLPAAAFGWLAGRITHGLMTGSDSPEAPAGDDVSTSDAP